MTGKSHLHPNEKKKNRAFEHEEKAILHGNKNRASEKEQKKITSPSKREFELPKSLPVRGIFYFEILSGLS